MDYKKKYKEALGWMQSLYNGLHGKTKEEAERYFPELKDSEDERIRREMIEIIKNEAHEFPSSVIANKSNSWIAWLEKQGEQESIDKFKPKFKIGDWITNGEYIWKVKSIERLDYILQSQNGDTVDDTISYVDEHFHLWTIQDAKDGDVLAASDGSIFIFKEIVDCGCKHYIAIEKDNETINVNDNLKHFLEAARGVKPATKEQRDLLFQKMYEAGYEWDANKKVLKKIK